MGLLVEKLSVIASSVSNIPLQVLFGLAVLLVRNSGNIILF